MSDQGGWGGQTPPDDQQRQQWPQQQQQQSQWPQQQQPQQQWPQQQQWQQQPGGFPAPGYGTGPQGELEEAPTGLISMILGILGLFTIPLVLSIAAIVLGNKAKREAQAQPHRYKNSLGKVGVITGWIGVALAILGLLFFIFVFGALISTGEFTVE